MPTLWIIDGYNFIRQSRRFSVLEIEKGAAGRRAALRWLGQFAARTGERVRVVFDAPSGLHREPIEDRIEGVEVWKSRGGYSADEEIMALAKEKGEASIVISSDREIQTAAIKAGASILKSEEFEREVEKILHQDQTEEITRSQRTKGNAFRPPKEKQKPFRLLRKYQ